MSGKKKKISPLDIKYAGQPPRKNWLTSLPDDVREFIVEARRLYEQGELANVKGSKDFYRFILVARDEHWPGVALPTISPIRRWLNGEN